MTTLTLLMFAATIALDVVGQMCFKLGLNALDTFEEASAAPFWRGVATSLPIWTGVLAYTLELGLWIAVLARMRLSIVFPLASLAYCGVLLASRYVLGEPITWRRWGGVAMITAGVTLVSLDM